jgi:hypothetical protein
MNNDTNAYTDSDKRYYKRNRKKLIATTIEWQKRHPKQKKESQQKWMDKNPDYFKTYYKNNKKQILKSQDKWRKNNIEKYNEYQRKYRVSRKTR